MSTNPRQLALLEVMQRQGSVTVEFLAEKLGVTLQTVRRDVQRLADSGLLTRFHGGVRVPRSTIENIAHQQREHLNTAGLGLSKMISDHFEFRGDVRGLQGAR